MNADEPRRVAQIHNAPRRGVLVVTGGGSGAIAALLGQPGASRTVLEASVPYSLAALRDWLGGAVESACSAATARAMAMAAFRRAQTLESAKGDAGDQSDAELFGVACTASLASDRPKRGDHRVHVAVQTAAQTAEWSLLLDKDKRTRGEEEAVACQLVLHAVAVAAGVHDADADVTYAEPRGGDRLETRCLAAPRFLVPLIAGGGAALLQPGDTPFAPAEESGYQRVLMPGAFAPSHAGHWQMLEHAAGRLGAPVTLELCTANVDKPPLDFLSLADRLRGIAGTFGAGVQVWVTSYPTFLEKAERLGVQTFVVGADTITRIADPRYYGNDPATRNAAIARMRGLGVGFLVFGRLRGERFESLDDLRLPPALRAMCDGVAESDFRQDISSTELRAARRRA
ncbi:MAG: hypothetical protein AAF790_03945 [Planctomycetota bacterium]